MKIKMKRKISTAPYETAGFEIEMEGEDVYELQTECYKNVLKFELFYRAINIEEMVDKMERFRTIHRPRIKELKGE